MHRFGRSAQQKMKDRWGGSFILATILALVCAWFVGTWFNDNWGKGSTASKTQPGLTGTGTAGTIGGGTMAAVPTGDFQLHFVQVGAFRSEASARDLVHKLGDKGYTAMMASRNAGGLYKVYGGLYTTGTAANEAKVKLVGDAMVQDAVILPVTVAHTPAAMPAAAMNDQKSGMREAVDAMNGYVYEVAAFLESGHADASGIAARGQELSKLADSLSKAAGNDAAMQAVAALATNAAANAAQFQTASKTGASAADLQAATSGYLTVLNKYMAMANMASATPATAPAPTGNTSKGSNGTNGANGANGTNGTNGSTSNSSGH